MYPQYSRYGVLLSILAPVWVFAEIQGGGAVISAFQQYREIPATTFSVPTVVEVSFDGFLVERNSFAVLDTSTHEFEPTYFLQSSTPVPITAEGAGSAGTAALADGSETTYANFPVPGDRAIVTRVQLFSQALIMASGLMIGLDEHVALPNKIELRAFRDGSPEVVLSQTSLSSSVVRFPKTLASRWEVSLTHAQPLRITELRFVTDTVTSGHQGLRFLAQPGHSYRVYFNPDRAVAVPTRESGDLVTNRDVRRVTAASTQNNPAYVQADSDADGVPDVRDNCVSIANTDQIDIDANGLGDACQDFDRDGVPNMTDNCTDLPNVNQMDADGDGIGDACDGEESRFTEKHRWVQWAGIGFAGLIVLILFAVTLLAKPREQETPSHM